MSGKGGAGKTTLAVNLTHLISGAVLADLDAEEPNCSVYTKGKTISKESVMRKFPVIDNDKCSHCGACSDFCRFNALLATKKMTIVMGELCHSCEGCALVCPTGALTYGEREAGVITVSRWRKNRTLISGQMNIGEMSAVVVIKKTNEKAMKNDLLIADGPPGTSCNAVEALAGSDFVLLAAEATPFGLSDMKMAVILLRNLNIPFAVVINKAEGPENETHEWLKKENISIWCEIPFSREAAVFASEGGLLSEMSDYKEIFESLADKLKRELSL